jgi:hypothetical protein
LPACAAPKELFGKSTVVTWTEERMQRAQGSGEPFKAVNIQGEFSVYVSGAGRVFNRVRMTNRRRDSGAADRVGNTDNRSTSFSGNTMVSMQRGGSGGARRVLVTYGSDFGSCTAEVIRGKADNADVITAKSIIYSGMTVEIQSVRTTGVSCSVRNDNVFGSE